MPIPKLTAKRCEALGIVYTHIEGRTGQVIGGGSDIQPRAAHLDAPVESVATGSQPAAYPHPNHSSDLVDVMMYDAWRYYCRLASSGGTHDPALIQGVPLALDADYANQGTRSVPTITHLQLVHMWQFWYSLVGTPTIDPHLLQVVRVGLAVPVLASRVLTLEAAIVPAGSSEMDTTTTDNYTTQDCSPNMLTTPEWMEAMTEVYQNRQPQEAQNLSAEDHIPRAFSFDYQTERESQDASADSDIPAAGVLAQDRTE
ncbi:hypothetical protein PYCC9005_005774 [Savitreella phatthalungensis]